MAGHQDFEDSGGNHHPGSDCGVTEGSFPGLGKCYVKNHSLSGDVCKQRCSHCSIWTSLPDGASLAVTSIFECSLYGYGKRIKE